MDKISEVLKIKNVKYVRNFQLTNRLINTHPFVRIKQPSKRRSLEAAI